MYTNREEYLKAAVSELRPIFDSVGFPLPALIRVACGFPSSKARSQHRAIGEHWSPVASGDDHHEILISPVMDDPYEVWGVLVHELCHAATDGDGHRGRFPHAARSLWLEGKPTSTTIGTDFRVNLQAVVESLGTYPHAALNVGAQKKTQSTRMLKAVCPACGYTLRLSAKWAYKDGQVNLPLCPNDSFPFLI